LEKIGKIIMRKGERGGPREGKWQFIHWTVSRNVLITMRILISVNIPTSLPHWSSRCVRGKLLAPKQRGFAFFILWNGDKENVYFMWKYSFVLDKKNNRALQWAALRYTHSLKKTIPIHLLSGLLHLMQKCWERNHISALIWNNNFFYNYSSLFPSIARGILMRSDVSKGKMLSKI